MTFHCPHCGESVRTGAASCPACGSDADTGWGEDADSAGLYAGVPDEMGEDDYQDFLARELPQHATTRARWRVRWPLLVAALVILLLLLALLR